MQSQPAKMEHYIQPIFPPGRITGASIYLLAESVCASSVTRSRDFARKWRFLKSPRAKICLSRIARIWKKWRFLTFQEF